MSNESNHVENEISDHKGDLEKWVTSVESLTIPESRKDVIGRFVRDCKTLIDDFDKKEDPSMADLVDFKDRRDSLEIQYINHTSDLD